MRSLFPALFYISWVVSCRTPISSGNDRSGRGILVCGPDGLASPLVEPDSRFRRSAAGQDQRNGTERCTDDRGCPHGRGRRGRDGSPDQLERAEREPGRPPPPHAQIARGYRAMARSVSASPSPIGIVAFQPSSRAASDGSRALRASSPSRSFTLVSVAVPMLKISRVPVYSGAARLGVTTSPT